MDWQLIVAIIVWSFLVGPIQKWLKEKLNSTLWSWVFTIVIGIGGCGASLSFCVSLPDRLTGSKGVCIALNHIHVLHNSCGWTIFVTWNLM